MRSLSVSDSKVWPKEWKDDNENAGEQPGHVSHWHAQMRGVLLLALLRTKTIRLRL
jgi:hypothetical protein